MSIFSFRNRAAITPHDTNVLTHPVQTIYVGGTGTVVIEEATVQVTFSGVPTGGYVAVSADANKIIIHTDSTATNMLALW